MILLIGMSSGVIAAVAGFGIGTLFAQLFLMKIGIKLAVVAVAIPHPNGTALHYSSLRKSLRHSDHA